MQNLLSSRSFSADNNVALTPCLQGILPYQDKKILENIEIIIAKPVCDSQDRKQVCQQTQICFSHITIRGLHQFT